MSAETYQVGAHFKALNEAVLMALSKILENFFFHFESLSCPVQNNVFSSWNKNAMYHNSEKLRGTFVLLQGLIELFAKLDKLSNNDCTRSGSATTQEVKDTHLNRAKIESNLSVPGIQGCHENASCKSFEMSPHLICL